MNTQAPPIVRHGAGLERAARLGTSDLVQTIASVSVLAIAVHAANAWTIQPLGDTTWGRRALLLGLVFGAVGGLSILSSRVSRRGRAISLLLLGLGALVVAGPITLSRIAKLGLSGVALTGLPALAGGGVLTVMSVTGLVRSAGTWPRKLLAVPVGLVIVQFVVWPLGNAIYVDNAARPRLGARTPSDAGLAYESVSMTAADGTELSGWYIPSQNGAAVVLRHGSGSTRTNTIGHAAFLARNGFGVLMTDARGHGLSEGRINELGWHGEQDVAAALDFLEERRGVTGGIGILGLSMGGEEALRAAAGDSRIAAVVSEGAGLSTYGDATAGGAHVVARAVDWTMYSLIDVLSDASQPVALVDAVGSIDRPVLLISGDDPREASINETYAEAAGPSTTLWALGDTPHTKGLRYHGDEYERRVVELFTSSLLSGDR